MGLGRCLTDAGFPAELQEDGGLVIDDGPEEQQEAFRAAQATCHEQLPEPPGSDPMTAEEVGVYYDLQVEAGSCLEAAGFPVVEMVSRDTWVAQYLAAQVSTSNSPSPDTPWDAIHDRTYERAREVCKWPSPEDIYERMNEP